MPATGITAEAERQCQFGHGEPARPGPWMAMLVVQAHRENSVGRITVPSMNCLWSPVWRLSACLESGIIYDIPFNMQNPSKIPLKLKLGNSKVPQTRRNTLVKYSKFWQLQWWYSCLHTSSGGREPELAAFLFTYSYTRSPWCLGLYHMSLERSF